MKKLNKKPQQRKKKPIAITTPHLMARGLSSENTEMSNIFSMLEKLLHWAAIVDSSDDAIISKSIDGYITSWNNGAQRLYGYTPEEIIGKPISLLMPPEREDDFPMIIKQLQEGKKVEHYETKRKTKDGRVIDVSITVSPIRDSHGDIIGASKIARDITDRIENEKRRDDFVTTASHELKTPITSQKVFGELLEQLIEKNGHTQYRPYIKKINSQTERLLKLVEDLLDLSRVQTGRLTMEIEEFDLDTLIHEIAENVKLTTKYNIIEKGKTKKMVRADRERLGQVVTNLLSNAIKYSPEADTVVLTSRISGENIEIGVQDFGIGVAKEYHKKIFERFFRVNGVDEKTFPGMGIGLHVCREIIQRHGGEIWVESEKGKGSTFYFSLPYTS